MTNGGEGYIGRRGIRHHISREKNESRSDPFDRALHKTHNLN